MSHNENTPERSARRHSPALIAIVAALLLAGIAALVFGWMNGRPEPVGEHMAEYYISGRRLVYLTRPDLQRAEAWERDGFTEALRTPDGTLVFETRAAAAQINADQTACMGCLSECRFSSWSQKGPAYSNGHKADPRSFCIQKTLQSVRRDDQTPEAIEHQLMFSGHNAYRFASDPFYSNGFIPTVKQLMERIVSGR